MPDRRTRQGVEIARVGTFRLSTGEHTFTREQLAAAVTNAGAQVPRIGIGHIDPRFNAPDQDGDPAFGKVVNLRLTDDGDALLGDFDGMASWLDDSLDVAYPGRSLEAKVKGDDMRITAVKLLGTTPPGISTLKDLETAIAASVQEGETTDDQATIAVRTLWASTNLDDLRDAFYAAHPTDPNTEGDWWGVEEIQINPNQLIVRHDGKHYRCDWAVSTDGTFTFGDLVQVAVQYVDVAAASGADHVVYQEPVTRPTPTPKEESIVDPKILREQLGLAEDASDQDVTAKLAELNGRPTETQVAEQVAAKAEEVKAEIAASTDDGEIVKLDKETFASLKASAERGAAAAQKLDEGERDTFIAAAAAKGKFPPSRIPHYTKRYDGDKDGTIAEIDALEEDVVPVIERGVAASEETDVPTTTGWFPQLQEA